MQVLCDLQRKLINVNWLGYVAITASVEGLLPVTLHNVGRKRDNRDFTEATDGPELCGALVSVEVGQVDIDQDQIRLAGLRVRQTNCAVFRLDDGIALGLKNALHEQAVIKVVFDAQNPASCHHRALIPVYHWQASTSPTNVARTMRPAPLQINDLLPLSLWEGDQCHYTAFP